MKNQLPTRKQQRKDAKAPKDKNQKPPANTALIAFFVFVVIGSALFQILNIMTKKE